MTIIKPEITSITVANLEENTPMDIRITDKIVPEMPEDPAEANICIACS